MRKLRPKSAGKLSPATRSCCARSFWAITSIAASRRLRIRTPCAFSCHSCAVSWAGARADRDMIGDEHSGGAFAIIIDEAYSSQGGRTAAQMNIALAEGDGEDADDTTSRSSTTTAARRAPRRR
jgi:hypothetical protein